MNATDHEGSFNIPSIANGSGAAAILSAGIGSFALAILALAGDKSAYIKSMLIFYKPTGPLSGVSISAIAIWLIIWGVLEWRWKNRTLAMPTVVTISLLLLSLSFVLTFPPIVDLF